MSRARVEGEKIVSKIDGILIVYGENAGVIMDWCVYLLNCRGSKLYTGITNNLDHRLRMHEEGKGSKFVRAFRPFTLAGVIRCEDEHGARKLESRIKKMSRAEKLALVLSRGIL